MLTPLVRHTPTDGELIPLTAQARIGETTAVRSATHLRIDADTSVELSIDADMHPVAPGATLQHRLSWGNRDAQPMSPATLRWRLPDGASFVSASDGGVLDGGDVLWDLGTLAGNSSGSVSADLQLATAANGELLRSDATLVARRDLVDHVADAAASVRVAADNPLELSISSPSHGQRDGALPVALTATNTSTQALFNSELRLSYPQAFQSLSISDIPDPVTCVQDNAPSFCSPVETVVWDLGALGPGEQATVTLPADLLTQSDALPDGALIPLHALATSDTFGRAFASTTAQVGVAPAQSDTIFHDGFEGATATR